MKLYISDYRTPENAIIIEAERLTRTLYKEAMSIARSLVSEGRMNWCTIAIQKPDLSFEFIGDVMVAGDGTAMVFTGRFVGGGVRMMARGQL